MLAPFPRLLVVRVVRSSSAPTIMYRRVLQIRKPQYACVSLPVVAKACVKACVPLTAPDGRDDLDGLLLDLDVEGHLHVTRRQSRARLRSSSVSNLPYPAASRSTSLPYFHYRAAPAHNTYEPELQFTHTCHWH